MTEEIKQTYEVLLEGDSQKAGKLRRQLLSSHVNRIKDGMTYSITR